ncbi:MAG: CRISPR-associated endonuclease Cas2 [Patescibacteria group bacterium]
MKVPITDKFLWGLYNCIEQASRTYDLVAPPRSLYQYVYRDTIRLKREYDRQKARRSFSQFVRYLQEKGYIRVKTLEGTKGMLLTPKGAARVLQVRRKIKEKKKRKDGKWIMVIFDIPEKKKKAREFLRDALVDLGYEQFQKSVWICPYDVYKETEEAVRSYQTIPYVRLFLIEELT